MISNNQPRSSRLRVVTAAKQWPEPVGFSKSGFAARHKHNLATEPRQNNPTGKSPKVCPSPRAKIFRFRRRANHLYRFAPSRSARRALAIVTNVGMGCGGRGSVLRAGLLLANIPVLRALTSALVMCGELSGSDVDEIICWTLAREALAVEHERRRRWQRTIDSASRFSVSIAADRAAR
jgi:hypothetical protein